MLTRVRNVRVSSDIELIAITARRVSPATHLPCTVQALQSAPQCCRPFQVSSLHSFLFITAGF